MLSDIMGLWKWIIPDISDTLEGNEFVLRARVFFRGIFGGTVLGMATVFLSSSGQNGAFYPL
jgi:hypothetical protein